MKVFHLSHTDLDGYGCQFIAKEFFSHITFYNANYGREVLGSLITYLIALRIQMSKTHKNSSMQNLVKQVKIHKNPQKQKKNISCLLQI